MDEALKEKISALDEENNRLHSRIEEVIKIAEGNCQCDKNSCIYSKEIDVLRTKNAILYNENERIKNTKFPKWATEHSDTAVMAQELYVSMNKILIALDVKYPQDALVNISAMQHKLSII